MRLSSNPGTERVVLASRPASEEGGHQKRTQRVRRRVRDDDDDDDDDVLGRPRAARTHRPTAHQVQTPPEAVHCPRVRKPKLCWRKPRLLKTKKEDAGGGEAASTKAVPPGQSTGTSGWGLVLGGCAAPPESRLRPAERRRGWRLVPRPRPVGALTSPQHTLTSPQCALTSPQRPWRKRLPARRRDFRRRQKPAPFLSPTDRTSPTAPLASGAAGGGQRGPALTMELRPLQPCAELVWVVPRVAHGCFLRQRLRVLRIVRMRAPGRCALHARVRTRVHPVRVSTSVQSPTQVRRALHVPGNVCADAERGEPLADSVLTYVTQTSALTYGPRGDHPGPLQDRGRLQPDELSPKGDSAMDRQNLVTVLAAHMPRKPPVTPRDGALRPQDLLPWAWRAQRVLSVPDDPRKWPPSAGDPLSPLSAGTDAGLQALLRDPGPHWADGDAQGSLGLQDMAHLIAGAVRGAQPEGPLDSASSEDGGEPGGRRGRAVAGRADGTPRA
ncbi:PREDICTED: receptor-type tyrosine-protein phosphatase N2 [Condylura cristata]|uniref:receptor-type tyrosine-protein phosphatase N2 n=1 Tax=Condylura cristata TaxID=143302 RepID=UPI000642EA7C|nr:PREDICTED: receptor-type tyrosine-protein phosphatase N2 [Condylura cristata]